MRPALYNAKYRFENISSDSSEKSYEVVTLIYESTDTFGEHLLAETKRGDISESGQQEP
ncbi:MAG: hypothetical protein OXH57_03795 [Ekhidna sp.]|nr:hypothetical protein [Ekhidna sp.]